MKKLLILFLCFSSILVILIVAIASSPQTILNLYINHIERSKGIEIDFSPRKISLFKEWVFSDVEITGKAGSALSIKDISIQPDFSSTYKGTTKATCRIKDLKFYKNLALLDAVFNLLKIQPLGDVTFQTIETDLVLTKDAIQTHNLLMQGNNIRISGTGTVDKKNGSMDYSLRFSLSEKITSDVSEAIRFILLKEHETGWMGIDITVSGNYKKPRIALKSGLMDLNIRSLGIK